MRRWLASIVLLAIAALPVSAAEAEAVLRIEGMNCALCPLTIRKALQRVPGVLEARVDYEAKRAWVRYDPARADPKSLARAVTEAGYPAKPEGS